MRTKKFDRCIKNEMEEDMRKDLKEIREEFMELRQDLTECKTQFMRRRLSVLSFNLHSFHNTRSYDDLTCQSKNVV